MIIAARYNNEKRFPFAHWLAMDIGGRIPPLLAAPALLLHPILPWFDFFVVYPMAM